LKDYLISETEKREEDTIIFNRKVEARAKMNHYGKVVRTIHRPSVSEVKRREVEELITRIPNNRLVLNHS